MRLKVVNTLADVPPRYKLAAAAAKGLGWPIQLRCTAGMQRVPTHDEYELWAQPPGEAWMHFYPHQSLTHAVKLMDAMAARLELTPHHVNVYDGACKYHKSFARGPVPMEEMCRAIMFAAAMHAPDEFVFHASEEH